MSIETANEYLNLIFFRYVLCIFNENCNLNNCTKLSIKNSYQSVNQSEIFKVA